MPEIVESDGYSGPSLRCFPCFFPAADWFRRVDVINRACRRRQLPMRPGSFLRGGAPLPTSYRQVFLFYEPAERDRIIGFEYRPSWRSFAVLSLDDFLEFLLASYCGVRT